MAFAKDEADCGRGLTMRWQKITVGEITPTLQQQRDIYFTDGEGREWQLILCLGINTRYRLAGRIFYRWLLFNGFEGYQERNLSPKVHVHVDLIDWEKL